MGAQSETGTQLCRCRQELVINIRLVQLGRHGWLAPSALGIDVRRLLVHGSVGPSLAIVLSLFHLAPWSTRVSV